MLSVSVSRALPVSGCWAPHSTFVISLNPHSRPRPLPLGDRGRHGIIKVPTTPHPGLLFWVGRCFLSQEGGDLNSFHWKSWGPSCASPIYLPIPRAQFQRPEFQWLPRLLRSSPSPSSFLPHVLPPSSLLTPALFSSPLAPLVVSLGARKAMSQP